MHEVTALGAPAGFSLGAPIALRDLLRLPPDGRRYTRDAEGRLALMAPDDPRWHRLPQSTLVRWLNRRLDDPYLVVPEGAIAFPRIRSLQGRLLPGSRLGPKTLEPDAAVFAGPPGYVEDERGRARGFDTTLLRLVVEVLSPGTHRQDLGLGGGDEVDRPRTYLESGVPEYWVLNPGREPLGGLAPRAGLFLRAEAGRWQPLPGQALIAATAVQGHPALLSGRLASPVLGVVDLEELWTALLPGS